MLALLSSHAIADGLARSEGLARCASIDGDLQRLACYDEYVGRTPPSRIAPAAPAAEPAPTTQQPLLGPIATPAAPATAPAATTVELRPPSLADRWDLIGESGELFRLRPYRPMYLLVGNYGFSPNRNPASPNPLNSGGLQAGLKPLESKFQVSFKSKVANDVLGTPLDLWGGYTQVSHWQVYDSDLSSPFRETNYQPELIGTVPVDAELFGLRLRMLGVSLNHMSNGRSLPLSRSWNRVIAMAGIEHGDWTFMLRGWKRISEDAATDDNPDIVDYWGRAELVASRHVGTHEVSLTARHTLRGGDRSRGSLQIDWAFPLTGFLRGHLQAFTGYGESLIDYNHRQTTIGVGISLADWF